jgi:legumain
MKSVLTAALLITLAAADHWAVIVAGSSMYANYRHQADACHAYQVFKKKGIPESNIIMMAYDDVAHSFQNPFKGKLFNKPDPTGPGVDVYEGCKIDYTKGDVTPANFANVLTGKGSGKVLKSTADDEVFVTFFDHGGVGLIAFPGWLGAASMHKKQLQAALQTMHDNKMYKKLVFYLEACESGSMFEDMNIPGIYGVSAANAKESSYGTYCGADAHVNGKNIGSCLGDLFSVNWLEDSDAKDTTKETLASQFQTVKKLTNKSHVMQWSDLSFQKDYVSEYIGNQSGALQSSSSIPAEDRLASSVSTREADMYRLYHLYNTAKTGQERQQMGVELQAELTKQQAAESTYRAFAEIAYPGNEEKQKAARRLRNKPDNMVCEMSAHEAFGKYCREKFDFNSGFALQFHQVVVNVCADVAKGLRLNVVDAAQQACSDEALVV